MKGFGALLAAWLTLVAFSAQAADPALSPAANAAFLAANGKKPGVVTRPSGLQYRILQNGFGKHPNPADIVTVYYTGALINGRVFDGTEPGLPASFPANKVIAGWSEALSLMREGDHWQIVIPAQLAYGNRGTDDGTIPPDQVLVFDLQLVSVSPPPKPPKGSDDDSGGGQ